jgi:manganese/zinc/iron transport system permease protein
MLGALIAGWLGTLFMLSVVKTTRIKNDSALGLILSVFFGFGLMLLTYTQKLPDAKQAGLDKFLFGQAATLLERDVLTMAAFGLLAFIILLAFWKEFKLISFNPEYAGSLGYPVRALDVLLTTLLVLAIVIGLQTVGVVLMSAMLVAPAAAARQWTDRLGHMVTLGGLFGALAGVSGTIISSSAANLSTGPLIVLCASLIVLLSLLFAPNRGLVWKTLRQQKTRGELSARAVLSDLNVLAAQHPDKAHGHSSAVLRTMSQYPAGVSNALKELAQRGWAREQAPDEWVLTSEGKTQADSQNEEQS